MIEMKSRKRIDLRARPNAGVKPKLTTRNWNNISEATKKKLCRENVIREMCRSVGIFDAFSKWGGVRTSPKHVIFGYFVFYNLYLAVFYLFLPGI